MFLFLNKYIETYVHAVNETIIISSKGNAYGCCNVVVTL